MSQSVEVIIGKSPTPKPPTAPETPAAGAAQTPPPTPEEISARAKDLYNSMGWNDDEPATPATPPPPQNDPSFPTPPAPIDNAPTPPAPEKPAEPAKPEVIEEEPEAPTVEDIIERTGVRVGRAVADAMRPAPTAPAPGPEAPSRTQLEPADQKDFAIIQFLERTKPDQFPGATTKFLDYCKAHYAYIAAWEKAHPGETYDDNADEHAKWYADNSPGDIDASTLEEGKIEMLVAQKLEQAAAPERRRKEAEAAFKEAIPKIVESVDKRLAKFVGLVNPELGKLVVDDKGKATFTDAAIAKLEETDSIAAQVLHEMVENELEPLLLELEKTTVPQLGHKIEPARFALHREIDAFRREKEGELSKMPASESRMDGREWMSIAQMQKQERDILARKLGEEETDRLLNELNARYWTVGIDHLQELIVDSKAKKAKTIIEKREASAAKKYGKPGAQPPKPENNLVPKVNPPTPPPAVPPSQNSRGKPNSPSLATQSDTMTTQPPGAPTSKSWGEEAADNHFK
jgi:hypothetical protein